MNRIVSAVVLAALAAATSGCAMFHGRSRVSSLGPPLDMPPAPARVVPIESQSIVPTAPPTVDDVPKLSPDPVAQTPPASPPARADREPTPPTRTEAPADTGAAAPPAPAPVVTPPPALQTANPTEADQRTRATLENAKRDLGRIDPRRLNTEARSQYQTATRFVQQAEEALKARNPAYAEQFADKAAQIAGLLQKQ